MFSRLLSLSLLVASLSTVVAHAIPAPADWELDELAGEVVIEFQSLGFRANFVTTNWSRYSKDIDAKRTRVAECYLVLTTKSEKARLLNRAVTFSAPTRTRTEFKEVHGDNAYGSGEIAGYRFEATNDKAVKALQCSSSVRTGGEAKEAPMTVGEFTAAFGQTTERKNVALLHAGSENKQAFLPRSASDTEAL